MVGLPDRCQHASSACSSRAETAAASQHSGGQASECLGEDPRPALGTATVSAWQCHSAGTGSSSSARGGGFEQPYGAQAFRGAEKGLQPPWIARSSVSTQLLRYISYTPLASKQLQTRNGMIGTVQTQERGGEEGAQPPLN